MVNGGDNTNILGDNKKALVKTVDENVKNKWNFKWLEEKVKVYDFNVKFGDTIYS